MPTIPAAVVLYWIPLGAGPGGVLVRASGRAYERLAARRDRRAVGVLFHSALEVDTGEWRFVVEVAPAWSGPPGDRGVVLEGPVGDARLGRSRLFRYEVRRWRTGRIPDIGAAVGGPVVLSERPDVARRVWELLPWAPALVWGRDELGAGEMWNSNSVIAWVLARSGLDPVAVAPPRGGRAPGWSVGARLGALQG
jgi:hypothetical protein